MAKSDSMEPTDSSSTSTSSSDTETEAEKEASASEKCSSVDLYGKQDDKEKKGDKEKEKDTEKGDDTEKEDDKNNGDDQNKEDDKEEIVPDIAEDDKTDEHRYTTKEHEKLQETVQVTEQIGNGAVENEREVETAKNVHKEYGNGEKGNSAEKGLEKLKKHENKTSINASSHSPHKRRRSHSQRRSRSRERRRRRSRSQRSRSTSHLRSRSRHRSRSSSKERSRSTERKSRRSKSLERRRQERKRRHAEQEKREQDIREKRSRRDDGDNNSPKDNEKTPTSENSKENDNATVTNPKAKITERQRRTVDLLTSRTGGAYIPPAKLRLMQAEITDKSSAAYQRIAWEALKKSIHGYINKVNVDNIAIITRELLKENIVRGRGLLCRSIIQAQAASPTFTHVYAALVAIINSKFPNIGELLLKRLVIQFKRAFRRNDKAVCLSASRFIGHLVNQRVAHEILALEILTLLVESPTDDSVEVAIAFLKECGMKLTEVSAKGIGAIFEMLRNILHEGKLEKRVQYMIEVVFQVRKDGFKDHQSIIEALELVEEDDQFTHLMMLDEANDTEDILNVFKFDDQYQNNEEKYKDLSKEILGSDASDSGDSNGSESDSEDSSDDEADNEEKTSAGDIIDSTETNLIALRRTIYLTINSSLDYEECAHKLMKMQLKPGQEIELCHMFLDCCAEQRTYEKFYGLLAQRFCTINRIYIAPFEEIFKDTYQTTHRLDTNRLRNVSKFFAHLLFTDAIGWDVLECIKLNEDDTTSSSRIFIKILFQELAEYMGLSKLNSKLKDGALSGSLAGLFPKDNPRNTRFAINFFTSIGLGGLTDELRQFLKNAPKSVPAINVDILANKPVKVESSHSTNSSSSSDSSDSSSSSSSSSSSETSESEKDKKKRKKKNAEKSKQKLKEKSRKKKKRGSKSSNVKQKSKKRNSKRADSNEESSGSESDSESSSSSSTSSDSTSGKGKKSHKKKSNKTKQKKLKKIKSKVRTEHDDRRRYQETKRDDNREKIYEKERDRDRKGREERNRYQRTERDRENRDSSKNQRSSRNYTKERG